MTSTWSATYHHLADSYGTKMWDGDILTNPPYKYEKEFIEHAMTIIPDGRKVFMFLKLQFLEGKARGELFKKYPPRYAKMM